MTWPITSVHELFFQPLCFRTDSARIVIATPRDYPFTDDTELKVQCLKHCYDTEASSDSAKFWYYVFRGLNKKCSTIYGFTTL